MPAIFRETSPRLKARLAGTLYLLIILGSLFIPFAIAPTGMMRGNAALPTSAQIVASKSVYVFSGAAQLFLGACDIGIALLFYELLRPVNREISLLAAFLRLAFVAIASANVVNHFAPLILLNGTSGLNAFPTEQLHALAILFIRLRTLGFDIALVFFGFHCILLGYLIFRSTFLPRLLGLLLALGGVGYVSNIFASTIPRGLHLFPYIMLPAGIAELWLTLWLLIVGVNVQRWEEQASGGNALLASARAIS